jgi:hypothetical protein
VVEALGFLIGQLHDFAGPIGKAFVHGKSCVWVSMFLVVASEANRH